MSPVSSKLPLPVTVKSRSPKDHIELSERSLRALDTITSSSQKDPEHEVGGPAAHQPFTAPADSPWIRCRCRYVKRMATGTVLMITPAESCPHWISYWPTI